MRGMRYRPPSSDVAEPGRDRQGDDASRPHTTYDSHPPPQQRIASVEALAVERDAQPDHDALIWALFDDHDDLKRVMTAEVRARILENRGIIAGAEEAAQGQASDARR